MIRLVKWMQLVQWTPGRFTGWVWQKFPSVGKINDWNGLVFFFATANLYLSVIKMLSAKEIPCSFSQTWGHPFSLWCYGGLCGVLYSEPDPSQLGTVSKCFLRQPEVLLVPTESETRGNDSGDEFCEGAQPGHGLAGSKRCRIPCFKDQAAYFKLWDLMAFLLRSSVVLA